MNQKTDDDRGSGPRNCHLPDVMFRSSDNCEFKRGGDGLYRNQGTSIHSYSAGELRTHGFREYPFTNTEMTGVNSIRIRCMINGESSEIVISEKEWGRLFGQAERQQSPGCRR
jgi:hypothetical protein